MAAVWDNVDYADVYFETRGSNAGSILTLFAPDAFVPEGDRFSAATTVSWMTAMNFRESTVMPMAMRLDRTLTVWGTSAVITPGLGMDSIALTVDGSWPSDLPQPHQLSSVTLSTTGYALSQVAGGDRRLDKFNADTLRTLNARTSTALTSPIRPLAATSLTNTPRRTI